MRALVSGLCREVICVLVFVFCFASIVLASELPPATATPMSAGLIVQRPVQRPILSSPSTPPPAVSMLVFTTMDTGVGSLRVAIDTANNHPGTLITFAIPTSDPGYNGTVWTIAVGTAWPADLQVTANGTKIDGSTQPSANPKGPSIVLTSSTYTALPVFASNCLIKGFIFNGCTAAQTEGVFIGGAYDTIVGCYFGTNASASAAVPNASGIVIYGMHNLVGGTTPGARNIISGNKVGVFLGAGVGNTVIGNYIGTDRTGMSAIPNTWGIEIWHDTTAVIGGLTRGERNVISGNSSYGVLFFGGAATPHGLVEGNFVGTDTTGVAAVPNLYGVGVTGGLGITIGGTSRAARNILSGNSYAGVYLCFPSDSTLILGNYIGTDTTGVRALSNLHGVVLYNAFHTTVGGITASARNLIAGNTGDGVFETGINSFGNLVAGNYIGTDSTGVKRLANLTGVEIAGGASHNVIGGTPWGSRNVISGNTGYGLELHDGASVNLVQKNFIGLSVRGVDSIANGYDGILIDNADSNIIGGQDVSSRNIIAANMYHGIEIRHTLSIANRVLGNFIGTDSTGVKAFGNHQNGIQIADSATANAVGDSVAGARNIIAANFLHGVVIHGLAAANTVMANYIGTDSSGVKAMPNRYSGVFLDGTQRNTVGGVGDAARNVIAGHRDTTGGADSVRAGVYINGDSAMGNLVRGNYIGINAKGADTLGNLWGIFILNGSGNVIGGTMSGARNIISGNRGVGVAITGQHARNNIVQGNYIGTDTAGRRSMANMLDGIRIDNASSSLIGDTTAAGRNVVSGNGATLVFGGGVEIRGAHASHNKVVGNFIGTIVTGDTALPNRGPGVFLGDSANGSVVGDTLHGARNVIAGNTGNGITIASGASNNRVVGNVIGTNGDSANATPNMNHGIAITDHAAFNTISGNTIRENKYEQLVISSGAHGNVIGDTAGAPKHGAAPGNTIIGSPNNFVVVIGDSGTDSNVVYGNSMGFKNTDTASTINAVRIEKGARHTSIGKYDDQGNLNSNYPYPFGNDIRGGVSIVDSNTKYAQVLGNRIIGPHTLDPERLAPLPIDLGVTGPSCNCWKGGSGPNNDIAPPRILRADLDNKSSNVIIEGMTAPNAIVEILQPTLRTAAERKERYFAFGVTPLCMGKADDKGFFSMVTNKFGGPGAVFTVTATDHGSTSEHAQIRRPIIFVPGVGGTWLKDVQLGGYAFPPVTSKTDPTALSSTRNNLMKHLAMDSIGRSIFPLQLDGTLDNVAGSGQYGPFLDAISAKGFTGDEYNKNPGLLDLWRFPYDWRLNLTYAADSLKAAIDSIANRGGYGAPAISCEVDILAHSMGGLISSIYIRKYADSSQNRIGRFATFGTPYLGTPIGYYGQTAGYFFGVNDGPIWYATARQSFTVLGWDFAWRDFLKFAPNMTTLYILTPGKHLYDADHLTTGYLPSLFGKEIHDWQTAFQFLTAGKVATSRAATNKLGFGMNAPLWTSQDTLTHYFDDWRSWQGPPQVFRIVGDLEDKTIGRIILPPEYMWRLDRYYPSDLFGDATKWNNGRLDNEYAKVGPGDLLLHNFYRELVFPSRQGVIGDATVSLTSATLGHSSAYRPDSIKFIGTDFSGIDPANQWINDFAYFPCEHQPGLTSPDCKGLMDAVYKIINGTSAVQIQRVKPQESSNRTLSVDATPHAIADFYYIVSTSRIAVHVFDSAGTHTGPAGDTLGEIQYNNRGFVYDPNFRSVVVGYHRNQSLRVAIGVPDSGGGTVSIIRRISVTSDSSHDILFAAQYLRRGDSIVILLPSGGAPETAALTVDTTGDGKADFTVSPTPALIGSLQEFPAPTITPFVISDVMKRTDTMPRDYVVSISKGSGAWTWTASADSAWVHVLTASGAYPDSLRLRVYPARLARGEHVGHIGMTLSSGGYVATPGVPVIIDILDSIAVSVRMADVPVDDRILLQAAPNPIQLQATFTIVTPNSVTASLLIYDGMGNEVATILDSRELGVGIHTIPWMVPSTLASGVYHYRLSAGRTVITGKVVLRK